MALAEYQGHLVFKFFRNFREGRDSEIAPTEDRPEHQVRITGQLNGSGGVSGSFSFPQYLDFQFTTLRCPSDLRIATFRLKWTKSLKLNSPGGV